jgi:hypothetical protein
MAEKELFGNSEQLDTISRQWLMECVEEGWIKFETQKDENTFVHLIRDIAPSAQPVAKDINVPVNDCISRQAAIEALNEYFSRIGKLKRRGLSNAEKAISLDTVGAIKSLPSAQRWIPCKERLPEAGEYYFVTVQHFGWNCTEYRDIDIAKYEVDGWRSCHNVLAWCPLPEPWKGEKE